MAKVPFSSWSLRDFLEALASAQATPGGGSVAGLAGALAASLVAMVARLTASKKGFEGVWDEMQRLARRADELRARLLNLMDEDVAAFDAVMAAFRLPKETEAQKEARRAQVQAALKIATEVPYRTARDSGELLELAVIAARRGNPNAASDAGAAAQLARAAVDAALLNVEVNLGSIADEGFRADYGQKRDGLAERTARCHAEALAAVQARL